MSSAETDGKSAYSGALFWSCYALCSLLLVALGTWQVARHIEKDTRAALVAERVSAPPITLEEALPLADPAYRRVTFNAVIAAAEPVYLYTGPLSVNGEPGYDVIVPARITGRNLLLPLNIGWIPRRLYKSGGYVPSVAGEERRFEAVLLKGERPGAFTPENDDANKIWFWVDTAELARRYNSENRDLYAALTAPLPADANGFIPPVRDVNIRKHLPHAQYAVIWYSLFLILTAVVIGLRKSAAAKAKAPEHAA